MSETLDQGISFVQEEQLHHYNSLLQHEIEEARSENHYFLTDQMSVVRNFAESNAKIYLEKKLKRSLVMPGGLPYVLSATRSTKDLV